MDVDEDLVEPRCEQYLTFDIDTKAPEGYLCGRCLGRVQTVE